jgi:hypothetical protein
MTTAIRTEYARMHIIRNEEFSPPALSPREAAREADRHARMLEEIYIDIEDLDPVSCPPDRRFFKAGKEAWVYDHGKIAELVFVRSDED